MTNLRVHIERLVLDGLQIDPAQGPALQAALETELARLLAGGLSPDLAAGGARPSLQAGAIELSASGEAGNLGRQIAQAVYKGIGR